MSPLDDALRGALSSRTRVIDPSPDLLAGVEQRAQRMRRQKVGAAVAGSALAVGALGVGGPLLASSLTGTAPGPANLATTAPAPAAALALDPADPWPYRGVPLSQLGPGAVDAVRAEVATASSRTADEVDLTPLFGQVDETSGAFELVFVERIPGAAGWGVARSSESGAELVEYDRLEPGTTALAVALPGEAVSRLLVVAHESTTVQYCPAGPGTCGSSEDDGIGRAPLDGDPARDAYRVLAPDGTVVVEGPAPDGELREGEGPGTETPPGDEVPPPANAVDWPTRGGASADLVEAALTRYADEEQVTREQVGGRLLYAYQPPGSDRGYLMIQVWSGGDARVLGVQFDGRSGRIGATSLSGTTPPGPAVLAVLFPGGAGGAVQQLLVVPEPRAGEVRYAPNGTAEPQPVPDQGTEAAVVIDRAGDAAGDQLLVLDGDSREPIYRGTVDELLAGLR